MADPVPVLIKDLSKRAPNGTEYIPGMRTGDTQAYGFTLDEADQRRFHHSPNSNPTTADNEANGYGLYHWWINDDTSALWLKVGENAGSADWIFVGIAGGGAGPATQILEAGASDVLDIDEIQDGQYLRRVGDTIVGTFSSSTQVESVLANKTISEADASKVLLVDGAVEITLPTVSQNMHLTIVNVGDETVTVVGDTEDEGVELHPSSMVLPPAGSSSLSRLEAYTTGGGAWYLVPFGTHTEIVTMAVSDEVTSLAVGVGQLKMRWPYPFLVTAIRANVNVAPTGASIIVDFNVSDSTILSTKVEIEAGELSSVTATSQPVITAPTIADDAPISVDIDQVGSLEPGAGLKLTVYGYRM